MGPGNGSIGMSQSLAPVKTEKHGGNRVLITVWESDSQTMGHDPYGSQMAFSRGLPKNILHIRYLHSNSLTVAKSQL